MNRTISAPLLVPRFSVWITSSACASQTATSSPRQVGSMPGAHIAGDPNVVLIANSESGVIAKSYMYVGTGVAALPFRAGTEVVDELARVIVDLDDAARLSSRWPRRSSAPGIGPAWPSRRGGRCSRCRRRALR